MPATLPSPNRIGNQWEEEEKDAEIEELPELMDVNEVEDAGFLRQPVIPKIISPVPRRVST